jgi:hypothetical protein
MAVSQPVGEARQNGFRVSPILLCPLRCANTIGAATVGRNTICLTKLLVLRFFSAYRRRATSKKKRVNFYYCQGKCSPLFPIGATSAPRFA